MARVKITNVVPVIQKAGSELFRQSINTKSGDSLILPNQGDTMGFTIGAEVVEGKVNGMRFEYNFGGQQSLTEAIVIVLI